MKNIIDFKLKIKSDYIMLTLHSSELMPDGSPTFKTKKDINNLYYHLNELFLILSENFQPGTLTNYYNYYLKSNSN